MVDVASIVVAVISLVAGLLAVSVTSYFTWWSDERKRISESEKLISKYRDPLLLACQDLQSRLYNITDRHVTMYYDVEHGGGGEEEKENLLLYTTFLVGQYHAWTHILRRQVQFFRFEADEKNRDLADVLTAINDTLSADKDDMNTPGGEPFMLWRGQQKAIGEALTVADEKGQLFCMGYGAFHQKWYEGDDPDVVAKDDRNDKLNPKTPKTLDSASSRGGPEKVSDSDPIPGKMVNKDFNWERNSDFRRWFRPLVEGIAAIAVAKNGKADLIPDQRLRRLQHLMVDMIEQLDDKGLRSQAKNTSPCHRAEECACKRCRDIKPCICNRCQSRGPGHV